MLTGRADRARQAGATALVRSIIILMEDLQNKWTQAQQCPHECDLAALSFAEGGGSEGR